MQYSIEVIQKVVQGEWLNATVVPATIEHLLTDSRRILFAPSSLFFAFKGVRQNGHQFIASAYQKGVRNFIVTHKIDITSYENANFLLVENAHQAIHQLVKFHRSKFDVPIIGITGSNGKTIVKEWLFQLLHHQFNIVRSPRSYNSQLGVPLSVWQMRKEHELGIFEAGISTVKEMDKVSSIINCNIGIFTNIGAAHDEGFASIEQKIQEKLLLFQQTDTLIYCKDDSRIEQAVQQLQNTHFLSWSMKGNAILNINRISRQTQYTQIDAIFQGKKISIQIPFQDEVAIENAIHCWMILLHLNISETSIKEGMKNLLPVEMRLASRKGINDCLLINDSYNSDLTSLSMALNFLEQQSTHKKHSLILSDILQSRDQGLYQAIAKRINEKKLFRFIGIGSAVKALDGKLSKSIKSSFFEDTNGFLKYFDLDEFQSETILLKGARPFHFERIANRLSERIHQTVLEVNITALLHNLNEFSRLLKPSTKMMVMVKAAAYGSGSVEITRLLEFQNVDYVAVAYADEGVELRKAGIKMPIMVLNPEESTFDTHIQYQLEPEIYSIKLLQQLIRYLPDNQLIGIHLKIETGMNRLGFEEEDLPELIEILKAEPRLKIQSIFSHLSASEAPEHDEFSLSQIQKFERCYEKITSFINYQPIKHILNTSGIIRFADYQFDMVRLGIGLYGADNGKDIQDRLKVVNTLKARISQIKKVQADETVGYSRKGKISKETKVATVSIGYADGLPRRVGNGKFKLLINGHLVPTIGNICMDMCMVDVSELLNVKEGDEVIVFGEKPHVDDLSIAANTIPLEIFTHISPRVKRVYFQE